MRKMLLCTIDIKKKKKRIHDAIRAPIEARSRKLTLNQDEVSYIAHHQRINPSCFTIVNGYLEMSR